MTDLTVPGVRLTPDSLAVLMHEREFHCDTTDHWDASRSRECSPWDHQDDAAAVRLMLDAERAPRAHDDDDPDPLIGVRIAKCPHCGEEMSVWPAEESGDFLSLAARMIRMEGGCETGHKPGQWHMHEDRYFRQAQQVVAFANRMRNAKRAPRAGTLDVDAERLSIDPDRLARAMLARSPGWYHEWPATTTEGVPYALNCRWEARKVIEIYEAALAVTGEPDTEGAKP